MMVKDDLRRKVFAGGLFLEAKSFCPLEQRSRSLGLQPERFGCPAGCRPSDLANNTIRKAKEEK